MPADTIVQHTPGPWSVVRAGDDETVFGNVRSQADAAYAQWGLMGDYRGLHIADIRCNPSVFEQSPGTPPDGIAVVEANARLIAQAPALLGALEDLMTYEDSIDDCEDAPDCAHDFCQAKATARRAIAKARGQS